MSEQMDHQGLNIAEAHALARIAESLNQFKTMGARADAEGAVARMFSFWASPRIVYRGGDDSK